MADPDRRRNMMFTLILGQMVDKMFRRMFTDYDAVPVSMYIKFRDGTAVSMDVDVWDYTLDVYFPDGTMRRTDFLEINKLCAIREGQK